MQRDSYLPLRVIKERLAGDGETDGSQPPGGPPDDLTRRELLDAAEISEAELTELEDYGLIRRVGRQYGSDALAVARALAALRQYGVQARHLRAVKAAADREANLVEQVVAPQLRQRGRRTGRGGQDGLADRRPDPAAARDADGVRAGRGRAGLGPAARPRAGARAPERPRGGRVRACSGCGQACRCVRQRTRGRGAALGLRAITGVPWQREWWPAGVPQAREDGAVVRQMEVIGVRVEMPSNSPIVLLKEAQGDRYLPIWIGAVEATAIAFAQQGMVSLRPLTHDLFRDVLEVLNVQLRTVNITALRDGIFYANLVFSNGAEVSARPSDSIALALRTGAQIFASDEILDEAGVAIPDEQEDEVEKFKEFLDTISPEDFGRAT